VKAFLSTVGFERALAGELARAGSDARIVGPGVVAAAVAVPDVDPVFARQILPDATEATGGSVREIAEAAYAQVEGAIDRWEGPFSLHPLTVAEPEPGLASRATLVGQALLDLVRERRRRAWRRYRPPGDAPPVAATDRLLVQILAIDRARWLVSAAAPRPLPNGGVDLAPWPAGDAPVAIDRGPPSRAYQKLEEAFAWMGAAPRGGELCVDLGASPGGWTATALKRGARVTAVDRAPVAAALARDNRVATVIGNAFNYVPANPADWLLSDVICEPRRSLTLIETWLVRRLCKNLVVTVKFKGTSGYPILDELPPLLARFDPLFARTKQLAHNKNEVTVMVRGR